MGLSTRVQQTPCPDRPLSLPGTFWDPSLELHGRERRAIVWELHFASPTVQIANSLSCASLQAYDNSVRVSPGPARSTDPDEPRDTDGAGDRQRVLERRKERQSPAGSPSRQRVRASLMRRLQATKDSTTNERKNRRPRRPYDEMLFNGNPQMPVTNCHSLTAYLCGILAKTPHGARDVRFKSETRVSCLSVSGECSKESCPGCSWRPSAALTLQSDGTSWLTVKSDGTHGQKVRPKGKKLWRPAEVAAIKAAFPDKALLSSASVRQCLADAGLELQVPKERLQAVHFPRKQTTAGWAGFRPEAGRASAAGVRAGLEPEANKGDGGRSP